jgi:NADH-quinone oxidoreductase subunit L
MHTNDIWQMGGLRKKMPITWLCFLVGASSLAGLPPTSGFFSKDQIIHLGLHEKNFPILFFTTTTVFVTAFYIFKLYFVVFEGTPRKEEFKNKQKKEAATVMLVPICILAFLSLFAGLLGNLFFKFINPSFTTTLHKHYHYHHLSGIEFDIKLAAISCILAILGIICAWVVYKGKKTDPYKEKAKLFPLLENKYYIDELYQFLFINPALKLKDISLLFDLKFIDGIVNGIAKLTKGLGKALATLQTGLVNNYLLIMVMIFLIILLTKLIGG